MRILYDSKLTQFKSPFGVLTPGQTCTLHMVLPVSICTVSVQMLLLDEAGGELQSVPFARTAQDALYETWGGGFSIDQPGLYFYYNVLYTVTGDEKAATSMFLGGTNPGMAIGISVAVIALCFVGSVIGMLIARELKKAGVLKK